MASPIAQVTSVSRRATQNSRPPQLVAERGDDRAGRRGVLRRHHAEARQRPPARARTRRGRPGPGGPTGHARRRSGTLRSRSPCVAVMPVRSWQQLARSGFCVISPSVTARSASVSTDARLISGGHLGSVSASRTSGAIWVYVPRTSRTSSGCASAYASDSFIASVKRLTRSGLVADQLLRGEVHGDGEVGRRVHVVRRDLPAALRHGRLTGTARRRRWRRPGRPAARPACSGNGSSTNLTPAGSPPAFLHRRLRRWCRRCS